MKKTTQRGTLFFLLTKYFSGNEIERNEMGGACGTCGGQERSYRILVGDLRERDHLEDLGVDGKIILKWSFRRRGLWHVWGTGGVIQGSSGETSGKEIAWKI